jgi:hypothetical protein
VLRLSDHFRNADLAEQSVAVSAAELHVTVSDIKLLSAEKKWSDSEFISPVTIKRSWVFFMDSVGFFSPNLSKFRFL